MVQKRPFNDEEQYEISSKLPKQLKQADQLPLLSEIDLSEYEPHIVDISGEGGFKDTDEVLEEFAGDNLVRPRLGYEEDTDYIEEDIRLDEPFHVSFVPEYFYPDCGVRTLTRHEDIYSLHLRHPPQKPVPIGSNFQADIPPWNLRGAKKGSSDFCSTSEVLSDFENKELAGSSVIPMPNTELLQDEVGAGRSKCRCHDKGSIRCVRQHIMEAREKLKRTLGTEEFQHLGFLNMGEQVAEKWAEEEEQLFHEIVFSNPPSINRNFWSILSSTFPLRTKREIVSYYFNVFILQRRGEQNRFDPLNADSDNDGWRLSDEDDNDSVVESPEPNVGMDVSLEDYVSEYDEDAVDDLYVDNENLAFEMAKKGYGGGQEDHIPSKCGDKTLDERGDWDHLEAQSESCMSFNNGAAPASLGPHMKDEIQDRWPSGYNGFSNSSSWHDYELEPCDAKLWNVGYVSCRKWQADFLPTCSMIEEVFGNGSWNCKLDGKGSSY